MTDLDTSPIVAAVALDLPTADVVEAATRLSRLTGAPILPVHALPTGRLHHVDPGDAQRARDALLAYFAPAIDEGSTVIEPVVEAWEPAELVLRCASTSGAQMIVVGGGQPHTIRQWFAGSTAERIVRHSRRPVFVARGTFPADEAPIVCPVDLSPQSHLAFQLGLRMARLFKAPYRVITVIPSEGALYYGGKRLDRAADRIEDQVREALQKLVAGHDDTGVNVQLEVLGGRPVSRILDATRDAHLVVLGSNSFDRLLPATFGGVSEKIFRGTWASVLTVRDVDPLVEAREALISHVAVLRGEAEKLLEQGQAEAAVERARDAVEGAPGNAALHELLARAYQATGNGELAKTHQATAKAIRNSLG
jgi:nucleotide-binding universal stress UspA family protein